MFLSGGFACLDHNLFRGRDGLLGFLLPQARGCDLRFLDELTRLDIRLRHYFLALGFGLGQLRLYLLGIGQALSDLLTPHVQHLEDWSIGEAVKDNAHDAEAGYLGEQLRPVYTEGRDNPFDGSATGCLRRYLRH